MPRWCAALLCVLAPLTAAGQGPPKVAPPEGAQEIVQYLSTYHSDPKPEKAAGYVEKFVKDKLVEHPFFQANDHPLTLTAQGFGHIARTEKDKALVRKMEGLFGGASDAGKRFLLTALEMAGDADTAARLKDWQKDNAHKAVVPELKRTLETLSAKERKFQRDKEATTPKELDYLWMDFFITGEYAPVSRILDTLDRKHNPADALQRVAAWSVESNLKQHPRLAKVLREHLKDRPEASRQRLEGWLGPEKAKD